MNVRTMPVVRALWTGKLWFVFLPDDTNVYVVTREDVAQLVAKNAPGSAIKFIGLPTPRAAQSEHRQIRVAPGTAADGQLGAPREDAPASRRGGRRSTGPDRDPLRATPVQLPAERASTVAPLLPPRVPLGAGRR